MPSIKFDNLDAMLSGYVAGSLPKPLHVLMASHLELSGTNRAFVDSLERAAGAQLEKAEPLAISNRDARLTAIFDSEQGAPAASAVEACDILPASLVNFVGFRAADIPWKTKLPGFKEYTIGNIDGCDVSMFWIKPERTVPMHTHDGKELSLILQGAFTDDRGTFARGDISIADENVEHRPKAGPGAACIGFAVTDGPQRLTGSFAQRIGDILGAY